MQKDRSPSSPRPVAIKRDAVQSLSAAYLQKEGSLSARRPVATTAYLHPVGTGKKKSPPLKRDEESFSRYHPTCSKRICYHSDTITGCFRDYVNHSAIRLESDFHFQSVDRASTAPGSLFSDLEGTFSFNACSKYMPISICVNYD